MIKQTSTALTLSCEQLGCDRGNIPIVRNVSFSLSSGEALVIQGANGAGKSSLLGTIAGRIPVSEGSLKWLSATTEIPRSIATAEISILDHLGANKLDLSVIENLMFWRDVYDKSDDDVSAVIERTGLSQLRFKRVSALSAGQKRRLSFARIKLSSRRVWLLDEPTTSIDAVGKSDIAMIINDHLASGGMAVIATHEPLAINCKTLRIG